MSPLSFESLFNLVLSISIWDVFKVLFSFALLLYVLFAFVVVRQVYMMTETIGGQLELPLKLVAILHLVGAILVLILVVVML